ncbi:hypothetical protein AAVH_17478 [Aphelenchoides avenae]|nr:hypothetical protein AAVH_17478 [Aphelenchus avenae]
MVPHIQDITMPPTPLQINAYPQQAMQLPANFPKLHNLTDKGGSLLQIRWTHSVTFNLSPLQTGRCGASTDRRYVIGNKWDMDGISMLRAHLAEVLGHHWLCNTPKASAPFPRSQLHQQSMVGKAVSHYEGQSHDFVSRLGLKNGENFKLGHSENL